MNARPRMNEPSKSMSRRVNAHRASPPAQHGVWRSHPSLAHHCAFDRLHLHRTQHSDQTSQSRDARDYDVIRDRVISCEVRGRDVRAGQLPAAKLTSHPRTCCSIESSVRACQINTCQGLNAFRREPVRAVDRPLAGLNPVAAAHAAHDRWELCLTCRLGNYDHGGRPGGDHRRRRRPRGRLGADRGAPGVRAARAQGRDHYKGRPALQQRLAGTLPPTEAPSLCLCPRAYTMFSSASACAYVDSATC